jgi:hypothetical protein
VPDAETVSQQPLEDILSERAHPPEGAGATDRQQGPAYGQLLHILQTRFQSAKAYRVGHGAPQTLYLIGQAPDGSWIGVKTTTVDT